MSSQVLTPPYVVFDTRWFNRMSALARTVSGYPRRLPYLRFLFARPEYCPLRNPSTDNFLISLVFTSRWTSLPLAKSSRYRIPLALSLYKSCDHRARIKNRGQTYVWPLRLFLWCIEKTQDQFVQFLLIHIKFIVFWAYIIFTFRCYNFCQ